MSRKRGVNGVLRIQPPLVASTQIAVGDGDSSPDSDLPLISKNMKKLSLSLPPSAHSSAASLPLPPPSASSASFLFRKEESLEPLDVVPPYHDGPIEVIPRIWIGSEDNATDWDALKKRGIKAILNVAKEVSSPFDSIHAIRSAASAPSLLRDPNFYPSHIPSGRPPLYYLKLQWSHGQQDLVDHGFKDGMAFVDAALLRGDGCLIHCQCGISRSATMVIALVMRAAAERSSSVPREVWALSDMQGAYSFVKEKSPHVGPNMSLIYQLLEYEKKLKLVSSSLPDSDLSSGTDDEEEWGRRRKLLDDPSDDDHESVLVMQEAHALDKAMEDRIVARKSSTSSISSVGSGLGMGSAWRSRYAASRKRNGSFASNQSSFISEDLVEEDEEQHILRRGFDTDSRQSQFDESSPDDESNYTSQNPVTARLPPSAPVWKSSFSIPPLPKTAIRPSFDLSPHQATRPLPLKSKQKGKPRPTGLSILPPVPSSPVTLVIEPDDQPTPQVPSRPASRLSISSLPPVRQRAESRKLVPPPLHLRSTALRRASNSSADVASAATPYTAAAALQTPSQTLFVFPPSPTLTTRTPSTMTLMSNAGLVPFPSMSTPRVSTFRSRGKTRSFIGLGALPTPTVAFSKVDARGYVGFE